MKQLAFFALIAAVFAAGCSEQGADATATPPPKTSAPSKPAPKADLAALEKSSKEARAALAKDPKDVALVQAAASTIYEEAEAAMYAPELAPREKYPRALRLYREVVKIVKDSGSTDEKTLAISKMSQDSANTIEAIYKDMKKPVPAG